MGGILRHDHDEPRETGDPSHFDRAQVLKNTEANAKLGAEGERVRERLRLGQESLQDDEPGKKHFPKTKAPSALRKGELNEDGGFTEPASNVGFNEENIDEWDAQRGQTEKILEPNTPYMGTAKDTEYYDEDPVPDDLDLGGHA